MTATAGIQRGCLVIGDISGYTAFLAAAELDHAGGILDGLLETLVDRLSPPFTVANLEGDAVFCHAPEGEVLDGQTLLETIERAYDAFVASREIMVANTTCTCRACARIGGLSLKFVGHYGDYARSQIGQREEVTGSDVVLVHRLLKNSVRERTDVETYAFFSDAAVEALAMQDLLTPGLVHAEEVEHFGRVAGRVHDLQAGEAERTRAERLTVAAADAWMTLEMDVPVPPVQAWEYLTSPAKRAYWLEVDRVDERTENGRRGRGTVHRCVHGNGINEQTIVEWRPPELFTFECGFPLGGRQRFAYEIAQAPGGACVVLRISPMRGPTPLHTAVLRFLAALMREKAQMRRSARLYVEQIERDVHAAPPS